MSTEKMNWFGAASGVISLVLFFAGWLIYGNGPTVADDSATILGFFANNPNRVIWSMFVQGLATLALIWFMAALIMAMKKANETLLAVAAGLAFVVALTLGSAATIMRSGLAFLSVGNVDADTVAVIFTLGSVIDTGQNMFSAGWYLPVALAVFRTRFIPAWWGWVSIAAALWAIVSTTALNHAGFWSPDGAGFLNLVLYIVWVGGTSLLMLMHKGGSTA